MRDTVWLIAHNRLPVRAIVKWSCFVQTKTCPMTSLINCYRTQEIRNKMYNFGLNVNVNLWSVMFGLFSEKIPDAKRRLFWLIMCVTNTHIWKTRTKVVLNQEGISSGSVFKNITADLRRQKRSSIQKRSSLPWDILNI
ncbi:hypothetical protein OJAV_G00016280 [Oryzias javanicus]|uniref:Reverse transcriptase zinc-binding domain-containing protein n=1 Tax=Oryzias javanicus TaxID=123683 RepID=A0A3S2UPE8_ORYJA|nr:hypothetical protein OJAV_G00016280 [Oryzias javanicus]